MANVKCMLASGENKKNKTPRKQFFGEKDTYSHL